METAFDAHAQVIEAARSHIGVLEQIAERIISCIKVGGRVYILGNGGSAADAQHIAAELIGRFKHDRRALPAIALTTDTSVLTAVTNDLGGDHCFERQVQGLVADRDIVWALSVSGSSPNVLRAVEAARTIGATVISFTGAKGRALKDMSELCFMADHRDSDRVQEVHQLGYHLVCEAVEQYFLNDKKS